MKILIIGASGYIGSHVAAVFAGAGHDVSALHRPGGASLPARYHRIAGDLAEPGSLTTAAAGYDRVIHAGAPSDDHTDAAGAEALLAAGSPLLYTTGAAVLGAGAQDEDSAADPHPIAAGRPAIERRVLQAGGWVIRPGMVYGDGAGLVHGLLTAKATERGTGVYVGRPGTRWPVVHAGDLAALYLAVATRAEPGTIWHGISETVRLDAIATALGRGTAVSWPLPEASAELGLLADLFTRDQDVSAAKTRAALGWAPAHTSIIGYLTARPAAPSQRAGSP
jgi:nucleoside-diphosphate-sugar epimerase